MLMDVVTLESQHGASPIYLMNVIETVATHLLDNIYNKNNNNNNYDHDEKGNKRTKIHVNVYIFR